MHGSKLVTIDIDQDAIRENAARWPGVTVTASSVFSSAFGAERVRDGFLAGSGDWASAGEQDPWVELTWPEPIRADRVVLYDRTSNDNANGGTLAFGDGSTVDVTAIPPNGDPKTVTFGLQDASIACASRSRAGRAERRPARARGVRAATGQGETMRRIWLLVPGARAGARARRRARATTSGW